MILKGQKINLKVGGSVIAKSTSCSLSVSANTADESSKDDSDPMFDSPTVTAITWSCTNESFIVSVAALVELITLFKNHGSVAVEMTDAKDVTAGSGNAVITGLSVNAPNGENATVTLSLQGNGVLV